MDDEEGVWLESGRAEAGREVEQAEELPVAILWLPDPDTRRGWYGRWVKRTPQSKRPRTMGFGLKR